jgi:hypothetical protein
MKRFPFIRVGLAITFAPLLLAFVTSIIQGVSMWDEGSGAGGYIWFMMLTVPVGSVIVVIGLVRGLIKMGRRWK